MRYAFFPGCKIPYHLPQYGRSVRAVCRALGIGLVDMEFNCCGYPVRHRSFEASMLSAARNMALADRAGLAILTPCKCCFGNLRQAAFWLEENRALRNTVNAMLAPEGLQWKPGTDVAHLLTALDRVGVPAIEQAATRPLDGLPVAAHYGCHALRPSRATRFDNPLDPTIFERLLRAVGAEPVDWPLRLECCGNPLWGKNDALAGELARRKLDDAARCGARVLATACTYCQLQFDVLRGEWTQGANSADWPPAVLFAQLLGLALGLDSGAVGLEDNVTDPGRALGAAAPGGTP